MATTDTIATPTADVEPRIPLELQSIFLASNRGEEVHKPPKSAFRVFVRRWIPRSPLRGKKRLSKKNNKKKRSADSGSNNDGTSSPFATPKTTRSSDESDGVVSSSTPPPFSSTHRELQEEEKMGPPSSPLLHSSLSQQQSPRSSLGALRKMFTFQKMSTLTAGSSDLSETEHTERLSKTSESYSALTPSTHGADAMTATTMMMMATTTMPTTTTTMVVKSTVSPQDYVDAMIYALGYSTKRHNTLESAYYNCSTPLQQASFRSHMLNLVKIGNARELKTHLQCGLSPNPANVYGESLLHKVCRLGRSRLLQVLLEDCNVDVRVADEHGRTPLHEACAANSIECFELICEKDLRLLYMADHLNMVPLQFVPKTAWMDWILFLDAKKEDYWPEGKFGRGQEEPAPLLTLQPPHSRQIKDPPNALPLDIAKQVASGEMKPCVAQEEMQRRLARKPDLGQLIANLDEIDDLANLDYDSDITDSGSEASDDEDEEEDYEESDCNGDDDDDDEDANSAVPHSLNMEGLEEALNVLGITPRDQAAGA